jgi:hypothetical protein
MFGDDPKGAGLPTLLFAEVGAPAGLTHLQAQINL